MTAFEPERIVRSVVVYYSDPRIHETPDYDSEFPVCVFIISLFRISIQSTYVPVRKSVWKCGKELLVRFTWLTESKSGMRKFGIRNRNPESHVCGDRLYCSTIGETVVE
jgi:hypothetical protein